MLVLHSAWLSGANGLALWAEDGGRPRATPPRRGRPPRQRRPQPHPFALDVDGIRFAATELGGAVVGDLIVKAHEAELFLRLPTSGGGPIGSPWLEDDPATAPLSGSSPSASSPPSWTAPGIVF
ncbi:MAG TPA: hypothetical protein VNG12_21125, partial [Acidimicrobiales bacterium]|nr:hypothetical protein [Acidimicrobiales bacterium]